MNLKNLVIAGVIALTSIGAAGTAFAASPELKAAMEKAGVKGAPQVWITTKSTK